MGRGFVNHNGKSRDVDVYDVWMMGRNVVVVDVMLLLCMHCHSYCDANVLWYHDNKLNDVCSCVCVTCVMLF